MAETDWPAHPPACAPRGRGLAAHRLCEDREELDTVARGDRPRPRRLAAVGSDQRIHAGCLLATIATVGALAGLLWALGQLLDLAAGDIVAGASWVGQQPLTHVITDPVHTYLTTHAPPLGLGAGLLWWCWAAIGLALLVLSWAGSVGARVGWVLIGAATAAMVHTTTPASGAWLATGITACAWGLLSVLAFTGAGRARPIEIHTHPPGHHEHP